MPRQHAGQGQGAALLGLRPVAQRQAVLLGDHVLALREGLHQLVDFLAGQGPGAFVSGLVLVYNRAFLRDILMQIIDVIGLPAWRDQDIALLLTGCTLPT